MNLTRFGAAFISGLKAFAISGVASVGVLITAGVDTSTKEKFVLAVIIAFMSGGIKGLEKAYNYTPTT
jgi:hypothetical protein